MRTFRPGATLWPLLAWSVAAVAAAWLLERYALRLPRGSQERWLFQLLVTACVVLGPVAFAAHLARRLLVTVEVRPDVGLVFNGRRTVRWSQVEAIDHRAAPFRGGGNVDLVGGNEGCVWLGVAAPEGCLLAIVMLVVLWIAYAVLLPVLTLFSPWHARVVVRLRDGGSIVLRDLDGDDEFVSLARSALTRRDR
jgi:hypothetical protein